MTKVPQANGYVTTQTQFTRDATGRQVKQSGVGSEFALDRYDSDGNTQKHYTQYFYGAVPDNELIRLFGSNTGKSKHYRKNFVVDPNDQISVSYVDMFGRTVATCLAGQVPPNVTSIGTDSGLFVMPLHNNNVYDKEGRTISLSYTFGNTIKAQNNRDTFEYSLEGWVNELNNSGIQICQTCQYQLSVRLNDPFGAPVTLTQLSAPQPNVQFTNGNKNLEAVFGKDVPCSTPPVVYPKIVFSAPVNKIGTYTVTKELKILTDPIDSIKMDTVHGVVSYERFKDSLLYTILDSTSCDFGCTQYVVKYLNDSLMASDQHRKLDTVTIPGDKVLYHYYYSKWCDMQERLLGDTTRLAFQQCESIYEQIRAAVSPGGKYFTEAFIMQYRNTVPDLYNKSFAEIRAMWKADYADSFALFHPEYCHYEACINDSVSNRLDVKLSRIFTWTEAQVLLGTPQNPAAYDPDFALYQQKFNQYYEVVINRNVLNNPKLNLYDFIDWTHQNYGAYPPYNAAAIIHEYEPQRVMYADVDFTGYTSNPSTPYQYGLPKPVINRLDTLKWFHFRNLMTALRKEAKAIQLEANGCRFLPDDSAIVVYPIANRGNVPSGHDIDSIIGDVCRQTCEGFADRYYPRVLAYCHQGNMINPDDSLELRRLLKKYCTENCGIDNPLGLLKPEDTSDPKTDSIRAFLESRNYLCSWDSIASYNMPVHYQYVVDPATGDTLKVTVCTPDGIEALMIYVRSNLLNFYTDDTSGRALAIQTLQQWGVTPNSILLKDDHVTFVKGQNGDCNNAPCVTTLYFLDSLGKKVHNIEEIIWSQRILTSPLGQSALYQFYANKIMPYFAQYEAVVIHRENGVLKYKRVFLYMLNYNWQGSGCGLDFKGKCTAKAIQTWAFSASVDSFVTSSPDSCYKEITERAENLLKDYYQQYLDSLKLALYNAYLDNCFKLKETFLLKYKLNEYQYTLYYYDQAGNLVQTVPPQGVYQLKSTDFSTSGVWNGAQPDHVLKTQYRYNTRNQVVWQRTPDADSTCFWYNAKGQLILSQNAKQKPKNKFSFTFYDHLGRILCVGEIDSTIAHFRGGMDAVLDSLRFPLQPQFAPKDAIRQLTLTRYDNPVQPGTDGFKQENLRNRVAATYYADQFGADVLLTPTPGGNNTDILFREDIASLLSGNVSLTAYSYDEVGNVKTLVQSMNTFASVMGDTTIVLPPIQAFNTDSTGQWASSNAKIVRSYYNTVPGLSAMKVANTDATATVSQTATLTNSLTYAVVSGKTYTVTVDMGFIAPNPQTGNTIKAKILKGTAIYAQAATATAITNGTYSFSFTPNFTGTVKITYDVLLQKAHSVYLDNVKLYYIEPKAYVVTTPNYKRVDYHYDLISGKVNQVTYQRDKPDQFIHRYEYDADNRITNVYTSRDGILMTREASYFYYPHGPLARIEIGHDKVQGVDYYYTLQGWLKGINNSAITENNDPGQDSVFVVVNTTNGGRDTLNKYIPKDQYNTLMAYYKGDYLGIDNSAAQPYEFNSTAPHNSAMPFYTRSGLSDKFKGLYNGNIAFIANDLPALALSTPGNYSLKWILEEYKYDQLNRIVESQTLLPHATTLNSYLTTLSNKARTSYTYDKNGNILKLNRSSYTAAAPIVATLMDSLTYIYPVNASTGKLRNNRLYHVNDLQTNKAAFTEDIDDQGVLGAQLAGANYDYDAIGQLTKDNAENIDSIRWNVYGKIEKLFFKNGKPAMEFLYDATGNRVAKLLKNAKHPVAAGMDTTYDATYYWRDAQGNVLATESRRFYPIPGTFTGTVPLGGWQGHTVDVEYVLYGSSRLGTYQDTLRYDIATPSAYGQYVRWQARRQYELGNHLGNVMLTLSDVKTYAAGTKGAVGYLAKVLTAQQYYPFGMQMPGKNTTLASYSSLNRYRFGFNGQERDDEVSGNSNALDFGERIYNSRTARFYTIDGLTAKYPWYSPYQFAGNTPIAAIDLDGLEQYIKTYKFEDGKVTLINVVDNSYLPGPPRNGVLPPLYDKRTGKEMDAKEVGMEQYVYVDNTGKELFKHRDITGEYKDGKAKMLSVEKDNWFGSTYIGPNNPEYNTGKFDSKGKLIKYDDYRREPQDLMDAAAMQHDKDYDAADAHGFTGDVFKSKAIAADIALVQRANKVIDMFKKKETDPYTGQQVSEATLWRARQVKFGFKFLINEKSAGRPIRAFKNWLKYQKQRCRWNSNKT
ncbi:MAG: RHS repeat-associated core domain-containing protein [Chitinophagales bacterium]